MVFHLLTFGRARAEKRSAANGNVKPLVRDRFIYQKIFLFGPDVDDYLFRGRVAKEAENAQRLFIERFYRAEKGGFFIERRTVVRAEARGDIQRPVLYKRVRRRIPSGVTARLEGCAKPARREARRVRLALYKVFAGKLQYNAAASVGL